MAGHLFLDMPNSAALVIVEMQMQFVLGIALPLLSLTVDQWNDHVVDKGCRYERGALWQRIQWGEFLRVEANRQH
jgi:hypothetical protein